MPAAFGSRAWHFRFLATGNRQLGTRDRDSLILSRLSDEQLQAREREAPGDRVDDVHLARVEPRLESACGNFQPEYCGTCHTWGCGVSPERARGSRISNTAPPSGAFEAVSCPPWRSTIARTIERPRPLPAVELLAVRDASTL